VEGCTDSFEEDPTKKPGWETRKAGYIERLRNEPSEMLLVSAADKLYNARAIVEDYRTIGAEVWTRFKRGPEQQFSYFNELTNVFEKRCPNWRIVQELKRAVAEIARLSEGGCE
jgi:GTP pyrophosphokinase